VPHEALKITRLVPALMLLHSNAILRHKILIATYGTAGLKRIKRFSFELVLKIVRNREIEKRRRERGYICCVSHFLSTGPSFLFQNSGYRSGRSGCEQRTVAELNTTHLDLVSGK